MKVILCPSDPETPSPAVAIYHRSNGIDYPMGLTSYGGSSGTSQNNTDGSKMLKDGVFYINSAVTIASIIDGTSNTLLFGERVRKGLVATTTSQVLGGWAWANAFALEDSTMNTFIPTGQVKAFPNTDPHGPDAFGSAHTGGANFALCDGSVRFVRDSISVMNFQALATRAGGEVVPADY